MKLKQGKISIDSYELGVETFKQNFEQNFESKVNKYERASTERYRFKNQQVIDGFNFLVSVTYINNGLSLIEMKCNDTQSLQLEKWLMSELGEPHKRLRSGIQYHYNWGDVMTYNNQRSGDLGVVINYKIPKSNNWLM